MIVGVAIRSEKIMVMLPKPNRHCHCFWYLAEIGIHGPTAGIGVGQAAKNQGFYTHTGKYLDREQAARYVKRIGQPTIDGPVNGVLFSENLW